MKTYSYKARDRFGKLITGMMDAATESAVAVKLKEANFVPVLVRETREPVLFGKFSGRFKKVRLSEVNMFTRQLHSLQKAGLPILLSLSALRDQTANRLFKDVIGQVIRDVEKGDDLSSAMERHPKIFNAIYVNMIRIGEASGILDEILERLAGLGEHEEKITAQIKTATRYPILVVSAIVIGFLILTAFVIPQFASIFGQFDTALPLPTRTLIGINYAITNYWWLILLMTGALVFGFLRAINTRKGRFLWDGYKLKVPVFGPLIVGICMSRFTRILGLLLRSGVPILKVLELASSGTGNTVISRTIDNIRVSVNEGKGMLEPMRFSGMFPPTVVQMVSVGEDTGKVDELLLHVAGYYDSQVEYTIANLTSMIEPILICVLGCGVLFMALGIFLPMWNMTRLFTQ